MNTPNEIKIKQFFYLINIIFSLFFIGILLKYFYPSKMVWEIGHSKDVSNFFLNVSFSVMGFGIFFIFLAEIFWKNFLFLFYGKKIKGFTFPFSFVKAVIFLFRYLFLIWMASIFFNFCLYHLLMGGEIVALIYVLVTDTIHLRKHVREF